MVDGSTELGCLVKKGAVDVIIFKNTPGAFRGQEKWKRLTKTRGWESTLAFGGGDEKLNLVTRSRAARWRKLLLRSKSHRILGVII